MSLPGQVGIGLRAKRSTQRRMRSFSQWHTDVHGQSTGGALHANGKRFISLDDRSWKGAVNFRELPTRGHHLSLSDPYFAFPSFQLRQRYFIARKCRMRSRFENLVPCGNMCPFGISRDWKSKFSSSAKSKRKRPLPSEFIRFENIFLNRTILPSIRSNFEFRASIDLLVHEVCKISLLVRDSKFFQRTTTPISSFEIVQRGLFFRRGRFVAIEGGGCARKKEQDIERNQIKVVLARGILEGTRYRERKKREGERERDLWGKKGEIRKTRKDCEGGGGRNDWMAGCSRRSNFQNGSSSIKQVLLSPYVHPKRSANPSQNVRRIPWDAGRIVSPFVLEKRSTIPRVSRDSPRSSFASVITSRSHRVSARGTRGLCVIAL